MAGVIIDIKCIGCGLCLNTCPSNALEIQNKRAVVNDECTLCGMCLNSCPVNAIEMPTKENNVDLSGNKDIFVFIEHNDQIQEVSYELLGKARDLADQIGCNVSSVLMGCDIIGYIPDLITYGSDKVYMYEHSEFKIDSILQNTNIFEKIIEDYNPSIVLFGATGFGKSLAPRVAARVKTGLTADCTVLDIDSEGLLLQTRPAFGGNLMATIICPNHRPQMASVRSGVMTKLKPNYQRQGELVHLDYSLDVEDSIKILEDVTSKKVESISDADIIVSVGRGIESKKNMKYINRLAELLGAKVGVSRPLVDVGWGDYPNQIGQTGVSVSPKLLIACGISGAVQHVAGIGNAKKVIAINSDDQAPIFDVSDYKIVGDLVEILKHMISELEKR